MLDNIATTDNNSTNNENEHCSDDNDLPADISFVNDDSSNFDVFSNNGSVLVEDSSGYETISDIENTEDNASTITYAVSEYDDSDFSSDCSAYNEDTISTDAYSDTEEFPAFF